MNLTKSITSINGQLSDLLIVLWISIVTITIRPEPELGVGVEAVTQDRDWLKRLNEVSDVSHLWFRECLWSTVRLSTLLMTHT